MKKFFKSSISLMLSLVLLCMACVVPTGAAGGDVYELAFDNLFVFEQWANNENSSAVSPNATCGTISTDIATGSFTLTNTSDSEIYTSYSMGENVGFYSMPVKPNTTYIFEYTANGTVTSFETFVFYFASTGAYFDLKNNFASQYGHNEWTFTTPENAEYIQIRFDNNTPNSYVTVSDIRICETEVYEYSKDIAFRKAYTYSSNAVYGELPTPQRENFVFAGWYTGPDGTGEKITASTPVSDASYNLYSKWEPMLIGDITIVSLPKKSDYCVGEKLNTSGLVISVTYPDGTTANLDSGFYCSPQILNEAGAQTITVTYSNKSAEFTVNVKEAVDTSFLLNGSSITVPMANYKYTLNKALSAFNRYEIGYSSDAYIRGTILMGNTTEEFFLEPAENGVFSGYIDGFLEGTTQNQITSITFTALDKDFMDFTLESVTLSKATNLGDSNGMVYLSDANYKIGIDLDWGGALSYLEDLKNSVMSSIPKSTTFWESKITEVDFSSKVKTGLLYNTSSSVNLINCNDTGRLVQQSYYGTGSPPYELGDYNGTPWNYNPVQGGNVHNQPSKIVDVKVTDNEIYVKCRPLDWGKTAEHITPSYMEAWYTLEDGLMRATCRFVDYSGYPEATTTQELPAFYCVEPLNNFVYYSGGEPWSDSNTKVTKSDLGFWADYPNQFFNCNENWAAFIGDDADSFGIGLYCPGQTNLYTGVFQKDKCTSVSPATEGPTSYIAAVDTFTFRSYNPVSYSYYITTGNIDTIRNNFKAVATNPADPCNVGYTNGYCNNCGKYQVPTLTTDKYDLNGDGTKENVYEISNAGELHWFSANVNSGDNNANAVLLCDITDNTDVLSAYGILNSNPSALKVWEPIGNATYRYNGIFDGQGYTVNGLYVNDSTKTNVGLFGYIGSSATVRKTGIDNSYFGGNQYVGGVCGYNIGTVENCYTYCTVVSGTSYVGGTVGYTSGAVKNCYNAGVTNSINNYCGGIAGSASSATKISNCYYLSESAKDGAGVSQNGIGNSIKGNTTIDSTTVGKTVKEFASGEIAYLLQKANKEQLWGQKTNIEGYCPVFDTSGEYKVIESENQGYSLVDIGNIMDDDDVIDAKDLQQLVNMVLSDNAVDDSDYFISDLDGDSVLDVIDCTLLERLINGHETNISVYLKGDFDFDGIAFTADDIAAMKEAIKVTSNLSTTQKYVCDLNFDKVIDNSDLALLDQKKATDSMPLIVDGAKKEFTFSIDSSKTGNTLSNPVSNVNIWSIEGNPFVNAQASEENNIFDFVEYVQLMQCSGGTEARDLFKDPLDRTVLDDYDFTVLVDNCRGVLNLGAKPMLKLGSVPLKYSRNATTDATFGTNPYPPDDYDVYYNYIYALAEALVDEFGKEEVLSWRFGVMTEYENSDWFKVSDDNTKENAIATAVEYCKLYDYTVQALIDAIGNDVFVGAHSMTVTEGLWDEAIFIRHCADGTNYKTGETGARICYLSASFYDSKPGEYTSGKTFLETIEYLRKTAESVGLTDLIYGIDEGRLLYGVNSGANNVELLSRTCGYTYQAAYDARLMAQMFTNDINYFSAWSYLSNGLLQGNPTVSYHVAKNAAKFAGSKLTKTQKTEAGILCDSEVEAISAFNEETNTLNIMAYNFKNDLDYKTQAELTFKINAPQFDGKKVKITTYTIDDDCNYFDEWVEDRKTYNIGDDCFNWSPDDPQIDNPTTLENQEARDIYFNELYSKYTECSKLTPSEETVTVENGKITLNTTLDPHAVVFYEISEVK